MALMATPLFTSLITLTIKFFPEQEELKRLKEKQAKRKEIRAEQGLIDNHNILWPYGYQFDSDTVFDELIIGQCHAMNQQCDIALFILININVSLAEGYFNIG